MQVQFLNYIKEKIYFAGLKFEKKDSEMIFVQIILLMVIVHNVTSIPCLSDESKKDFNDSRIALKDMESNLKITAKKLENSFNKITASIGDQLVVVKTALTTVGKNVKKVDKLLQVLGKDFQSKKYSLFIRIYFLSLFATFKKKFS